MRYEFVCPICKRVAAYTDVAEALPYFAVRHYNAAHPTENPEGLSVNGVVIHFERVKAKP